MTLRVSCGIQLMSTSFIPPVPFSIFTGILFLCKTNVGRQQHVQFDLIYLTILFMSLFKENILQWRRMDDTPYWSALLITAVGLTHENILLHYIITWQQRELLDPSHIILYNPNIKNIRVEKGLTHTVLDSKTWYIPKSIRATSPTKKMYMNILQNKQKKFFKRWKCKTWLPVQGSTKNIRGIIIANCCSLSTRLFSYTTL